MSDNFNPKLGDCSPRNFQEKVKEKSLLCHIPHPECIPFLDNKSDKTQSTFPKKTSTNLQDSPSECEENQKGKSFKQKNKKSVQSFRKTQASSNENILKATPESKNLSIEQGMLTKNVKESSIEKNTSDDVNYEVKNNKKNKRQNSLNISKINKNKKDKNVIEKKFVRIRRVRAAKMKLIERFTADDLSLIHI